MLTPSTSAECDICRREFTRMNTLQRVCGVRCARQVPVAAKKAVKAQDKARREALKTRSDWMKEAQREFNAYIRLRDAGRPCICCGRTSGSESRGGEWDAGHYRSTGSAPHLRFDEANCHRQLKQCNRYGAGRAVDYRIGLIQRIGLAEVERLESDQTLRKWTSDDLRAIRDEYRARVREMRRAE